MDEKPIGGLFVRTGPPICIVAACVVEGGIEETRFDLSASQAADLGAVLLRLSGATEARQQARAESAVGAKTPSKPLDAVGVN